MTLPNKVREKKGDKPFECLSFFFFLVPFVSFFFSFSKAYLELLFGVVVVYMREAKTETTAMTTTE